KLLTTQRVDSPKAQARFQREVELTARLDHPNIARIYDSGLHQGMYYYAMELIEGAPLDQYVKGKSLSRTEILALMQRVCQAVLYAHLRAVIHRDLKPSNIIVDSDGRPHILDFGLAKALLDEDEVLNISIEGQVAGTPAYMSPEQAAGHHSQLDTRTDVYGLGVILYELLLGQSPHDLSGSMFELLNQIAAGQIRRPREIDKSIDSELEALLLKALAQNPEDRYASAGALAKDIGNYLDEEPLDARVPTTLYFLRKKALKYKKQVAVATAALLIILGIIVGFYTWIIAERATSESKDWEIKLKSAQLTWHELELKARSKDEQEARAALRIIRDEYVAAQDEISRLNHKLGDRKPAVAVRHIGLGSGPPMAPTALVRRPSLPGGITSWTLETCGHRGRITGLVYSPDGSRLASAGSDGTIRIWDSESGQLSHVLVDPNSHVSDLAWSVDGKNLQGAAAADPALRSVWSVDPDRIRSATESPTRTSLHDASGVCWSAGSQAPAQMLDEAAGSLNIQLPSAWASKRKLITALAFSPKQQQLAFGDDDGTIRILDVSSGEVIHTHPAAWCGPIKSVSFSPDGRTLCTSSGAGALCLWEADRWEPIRKYETDSTRHSTASATDLIAWAPDNAYIARVDNSRMIVEILELHSGNVVRLLSGNDERITCVAWSPESRLIAAGMQEGNVRIWNLESESSDPSVTMIAHANAVSALEWMPQNRNLITAGRDGMIKIWESANETLTNSLRRQTSPVTCAALSRDGKVFASCSADGIIRFWRTDPGWTSNLLRIDPNDSQEQYSLTAICWSPDGGLLACGDSTGKIRVYDSNARRWQRSFSTERGSISSLAWSANGRVLLCGGSEGIVRAWDALRHFEEHVILLPLSGATGPGVAVSAAGDYRGPPGLADHFVYAVQTAEAQMTLSQADFKSQYGWVNEPWQVGLYKPGAEKVERIYVNATSEGPYDGKTWETAFNDLQDALSIAQQNTEIWVAAGVYVPDRGTGARTASFRLKNGIRLLGGFTGKETSSDQRDPNSNETILSGDLKGDDGPGFANNDENCYHVITAGRTSETAVLDGFIVSGGNANSTSEYECHNGGGIYSTAI
ncbi:MAG: protein kinase, partial [Phycisphaerales bacterium]